MLTSNAFANRNSVLIPMRASFYNTYNTYYIYNTYNIHHTDNMYTPTTRCRWLSYFLAKHL